MNAVSSGLTPGRRLSRGRERTRRRQGSAPAPAEALRAGNDPANRCRVGSRAEAGGMTPAPPDRSPAPRRRARRSRGASEEVAEDAHRDSFGKTPSWGQSSPKRTSASDGRAGALRRNEASNARRGAAKARGLARGGPKWSTPPQPGGKGGRGADKEDRRWPAVLESGRWSRRWVPCGRDSSPGCVRACLHRELCSFGSRRLMVHGPMVSELAKGGEMKRRAERTSGHSSRGIPVGVEE